MPTYSGSAATSTATVPYYPVRNYEELLHNIARSSGIEPNRLLNEDALAIRDYINTALREGWEYYLWPQLMDVVSDTVANLDNYAEYDIMSISKNDPRVYNYPTYYAWSFDGDGINLISDVATTATVYITHRLRWYPFNGDDYSSTTTYAIGTMAYSSITKNWHRSIAGSNLGNAVTDTAWWDEREIPDFLYEYARLKALSMMREAQGQGQKAIVLERMAQSALNLEIEKIERQKNLQQRAQVVLRHGG